MLSFLPSVLIFSFFVQQKISSFLVFPSLTEKREKETPQHNQNGLWRYRTQEKERRGRQRGRKKASLFSLLGWLPDRVSTFSRLPESLSTRRRIFHPHFFLLGKALKSCPARMGWLSGVPCAPNSDSKEEKEKRRPGDGNAHGPLASESSHKNDQDGLSGSQVIPVNQFLSRMWWQPFPRAWFCVSVTALQRRGPSRLVGPWRSSHPSVSEWMWESSPRKPEQLTESLPSSWQLTGCSLQEPSLSSGLHRAAPNSSSIWIKLHRVCLLHACASWAQTMSVSPQDLSEPRSMTLSSMAQAHRGLFLSSIFYVHAGTHSYHIILWHYFQKREVVGVLCEIL